MSAKKRSSSSYILRDYDEKNTKGIIEHSFFETFHRKYYARIVDKELPDEIANNQIKLLYWTYQQKKYFDNPDFWMPLKTELRLMTERQRGIIDCLEMCSKNDGLRIIDYKPEPSEYDKHELLFYANLLNDFRTENRDSDELMYDVIEIGCYYYEKGFESIYKLELKELNNFQKSFTYILDEIAKEIFPFKSSRCNCIYFDLCEIEKRNLK